MRISGIKIGDNNIELSPKAALMLIGASSVIVAFIDARADYALPLFVIGMIFVLLAGDYYKEF